MISLVESLVEESDEALVRRFAAERSEEAFAALVARYGDMVFAICRRILGNDSEAADVAQETFVQLANNAGRLNGSLGSWLNRVATRRSVDLIRRNSARRRREESYASNVLYLPDAWTEVEPLVHEVLRDLPENLRQLLVQRFLEGQTAVQISGTCGMSQPTVSRRLQQALRLVRRALRSRGVCPALAPLKYALSLLHGAASSATRGIAIARAALTGGSWVAPVAPPGVAAAAKVAVAASVVALAAGTALVLRQPDGRAAAPPVAGSPTGSVPRVPAEQLPTLPAAALVAPVVQPMPVVAEVDPVFVEDGGYPVQTPVLPPSVLVPLRLALRGPTNPPARHLNSTGNARVANAPFPAHPSSLPPRLIAVAAVVAAIDHARAAAEVRHGVTAVPTVQPRSISLPIRAPLPARVPQPKSEDPAWLVAAVHGTPPAPEPAPKGAATAWEGRAVGSGPTGVRPVFRLPPSTGLKTSPTSLPVRKPAPLAGERTGGG